MQTANGKEHQVQRLIGSYECDQPGPTLVLIGGTHGNEPSGPEAIERVLDGLRAQPFDLRGRVVGLRGNLPALQERVRYLERDLNRNWTVDEIENLRARKPEELLVEDVQQIELLSAIEEVLSKDEGPFLFLDLHSTSGEGPPFAFLCGASPVRRLLRHFEIPIILGVEDVLQGTLMDYLTDRGHVAVGVEGGQHDAKEAVSNLEAIIWIALSEWGLIQEQELRDLSLARATLQLAVRTLPREVRVMHRHELLKDDGFQMAPGFANFDRVQGGQVLASDRGGEIASPEPGRILLPLYQGLGEEGFLLIQDVPVDEEP